MQTGKVIVFKEWEAAGKCAARTRIYSDAELVEGATIRKFRIVQDRLFLSDFDKYMLELEEAAKQSAPENGQR